LRVVSQTNKDGSKQEERLVVGVVHAALHALRACRACDSVGYRVS
jgi:hypothetical protein